MVSGSVLDSSALRLLLVPTPAQAQFVKDALLEVYSLEEAGLTRETKRSEGYFPNISYPYYSANMKRANMLRQVTYQQWADLLTRNGIALEQFPHLRNSP